MKQRVPFFCNFLCAAALLGAGGNLPAETQEEDTQGIVVQNKAPSEVGCPVARYAVRFGKDVDVDLIDLSAFNPHDGRGDGVLAGSQRHSAGE